MDAQKISINPRKWDGAVPQTQSSLRNRLFEYLGHVLEVIVAQPNIDHVLLQLAALVN